jgi:hypothetical protein
MGSTLADEIKPDIWWEMHPPVLEGNKRHAKHIEYLKRITCRKMMQKAYPEIPQSEAYPLAEMICRFGHYFTCSQAYALAYAIHKGYSSIALYGCDFTEDYLGYHPPAWSQRANMEYLLGYARGMGIEIELPLGSNLLRQSDLYGYGR